MQKETSKNMRNATIEDKPVVSPFQDEISEARAIQQAEQFIGEGCLHVW